MAIYILHEDSAECARMLDDKSLEAMIWGIAQVLCNVHWLDPSEDIYAIGFPGGVPLPVEWASPADCKCKWSQWARECKANYRYLVKLGIYCCREYHYRNDEKCDPKIVEDGDDHCGAWHKMRDVIDWARDNEPDLPDATQTDNPYIIRCMFNGTPLPLVMPKKHKDVWMQKSFYSEDDDDKKNATIYAYRNFYRAKLKQRYGSWKDGIITATQVKNREKDMSVNGVNHEPEWLGDL